MNLFEDSIPWPRNREKLFDLGTAQVMMFCIENKLLPLQIDNVPSHNWRVSACAYYRDSIIRICLPQCALPAVEGQTRAWSWPGSISDRTPYGVLCHELGHHADMRTGKKKGSYGSDYSTTVMDASGEPPITSYAPNPWEWFAEMFRLFVTSPFLLQEIRPRTFDLLTKKFKPVGDKNWEAGLGANVPPRIIANLRKKVADAKRRRK